MFKGSEASREAFIESKDILQINPVHIEHNPRTPLNKNRTFTSFNLDTVCHLRAKHFRVGCLLGVR